MQARFCYLAIEVAPAAPAPSARRQRAPSAPVRPRPIKNPRLPRASDSPGQAPERFRAYLHGVAHSKLDRRLQGKVDPADLVQQTLLKAHQRFDQFRGKSDAELAGWLRRILANTMADTYRKYQRAVSLERSLTDVVDESSLRFEDCLADHALSPGEQAARHEQMRRLAAALEQMPAEQRVVIQLRYLEGCTLADAAVVVQRSRTAVAGLLRRGLARLRKELASA